MNAWNRLTAKAIVNISYLGSDVSGVMGMHRDCLHFFLSSTSFSAMYNFHPSRSTEQVGRHLTCEEALEMYETLACLCQRWRVPKNSEL